MIRLLSGIVQQSCPFVKTFGALALKNQRAAIKKAFSSLHKPSILPILTDRNQEICKPANSAMV
jgi:hypothetical protein